MSYILDALRKAERERRLGQPPTLAVVPAPTEPARIRFWPWLALIGLGLNSALLVFFLIRPPRPETVSAAAPATPPAAAPALARTPPPPEPVAAPKPVAPAAAPTPMAGRIPSGRATAPESPRPSTPPTSSRERREEPTPPPAPAHATVGLEPAPFLDTLPASARRDLPTLSLDIHIHSRDPDKRFVVINGRRYREGERLSEGPVLETVTASGAILRQGNQRFQLSIRR